MGWKSDSSICSACARGEHGSIRAAERVRCVYGGMVLVVCRAGGESIERDVSMGAPDVYSWSSVRENPTKN